MQLYRKCPGLLMIFLIGSSLFAGNIQLSKNNMGHGHPLHEELSFEPTSYTRTSYALNWYTNDLDNDGIIDYVFTFDDKGNKLFEVNDFNKDGKMDDFYFYLNGVFVRQEIDRNADQRIDLWVYIDEGIYVAGYEMDKDYDGLIDVIKIYAGE